MDLKIFTEKFNELEDKLLKILLFSAGVSFLFLLAVKYFNDTKLIPTFGGHYIEGVVGKINQINPALSFNNNIERDLLKLFYPSLMINSYEYGLALSSSVSQDQKEYLFSLRQDAKWEDGQPITADDVIFTFELIKNPLYKSPLKSNWEEVKIEKVSDYQVKFILPNPYPLFIENLTAGILPKHIWQGLSPEEFSKSIYNLQPLSGGPYILENIVRAPQIKNQPLSEVKIKKIELKRNEKYFGPKPYIEKVTLVFFDDENQMLQSLKRGNIDGALFNDTGIFAKVQKPDINLFNLKFPRYYALFFNQSKSDTLKNIKIRQIIAMAVDRRKLIEKVFHGYAELISSPIPINGFFNIGGIEQVDYDIQKAKVMLEDLANTTKTKLDLALSLAVPKDEILIKVADFIKDSLEQIGFSVKIESFDLKTLFESIIKERDYQMLIFGQALRTNPDPFSFWHSSQVKDPGLNLALYKNSEVDKILVEARQTSDVEKRKQLYTAFQKQILADIPAVFLYRPIQLYAVSDKIKGIRIDNLISSPDERFNNFAKWYIKQKRVKAN